MNDLEVLLGVYGAAILGAQFVTMARTTCTALALL